MTSELLDWTNRIRSDRRLTSLDEAATKQAVVLRVLGLLGWDPFDVGEIHPEYTVSGKRVDYALRHMRNNKVFIEVKKVNENLEKHQEQLLNYSFQEGVKLAILTNGVTWWFYLPLNEGSWGQRKFYTIEIYDQDVGEIAQKFTDFLSKENVVSGKALENAEKVYSSRKKKNLIRGTLPRAWEKLIGDPDEDLIELLAETTEKLCGYRPDNSTVEKFIGSHGLTTEDTTAETVRRSTVPRRTANSKAHLVIDGDYTGKSIVAFSLKGARHEVRSWKDMLLLVCDLMSTAYKNQFQQVLSLLGRKRPYFTTNPNELRSPKRVEGTDIFVETNLGSRLIVRLSTNVISLFGYSSEDLLIEAR